MERFNRKLKEGIPSDPRFPERRDEYVNWMEKENNAITQWLENFKSKYGEFEDAKDIIKQVEEAQSSYKTIIGTCLVIYILTM